nr:hypothetical protein [Candidatus Sigynarchaeum springense]MDO8119164.1 hypothetical protein [Candidatus Sigynarchaeota archaeon]
MQAHYPKVFEMLILFLESLESQFNWHYMIVDGVLTPLYAQSRMTQDIDVVLQLSITESSKQILIAHFSEHGFKTFTNWDDAFYG